MFWKYISFQNQFHEQNSFSMNVEGTLPHLRWRTIAVEVI